MKLNIGCQSNKQEYVTGDYLIDDNSHDCFSYIKIYEGKCHEVFLGNRRTLRGGI